MRSQKRRKTEAPSCIYFGLKASYLMHERTNDLQRVDFYDIDRNRASAETGGERLRLLLGHDLNTEELPP